MEKRERVILPAQIRGQGLVVGCTAHATKVSLADVDFNFVDTRVTDLSEAVPDGEYDLFLGGKAVQIKLPHCYL
jgi:hypothetical protein